MQIKTWESMFTNFLGFFKSKVIKNDPESFL